jgi:hypothetical protein
VAADVEETTTVLGPAVLTTFTFDFKGDVLLNRNKVFRVLVMDPTVLALADLFKVEVLDPL